MRENPFLKSREALKNSLDHLDQLDRHTPTAATRETAESDAIDREFERFAEVAVETAHGWTLPGHEAVMEAISSARPWERTAEPVISGVPDGWIPSRWVRELRRMAECCRSVRPDRADIHEHEAGKIEVCLRGVE